MRELPIIDLTGSAVPDALDHACRELGFFYVVGHGISSDLTADLERAARQFFTQSNEQKAEVAMARGGRAWRGWFPLEGELTAGLSDQKEGFYFGTELPPDDPRVRAGLPLHGANLFPAEPADLRPLVLDYLDAVTALGQTVLAGLAGALGLPPDWFRRHLTDDPVVLFRIFHYPRTLPAALGRSQWGVAEHTDYGLITLLRQDDQAGLEVRGPDGWMDAPPIPDSFVVNLGDMLERMTGGRYRSTPHRVRNATDSRLSFPLFLDPSWNSEIHPIPGCETIDTRRAPDDRWDGRSVHDWSGTYGDYLLDKVTKVFPELAAETGTTAR